MWNDEKSKRKRQQLIDTYSKPSKMTDSVVADRHQMSSLELVIFLFVVVMSGLCMAITQVPALTTLVSPVFCPSATTLKVIATAANRNSKIIELHCFDQAGAMVVNATSRYTAFTMGLVALAFIAFFTLQVIRRVSKTRLVISPLADFGLESTAEAVMKAKPKTSDELEPDSQPAESVMLNETTWQLRERAKRGEISDEELAKIAAFVQTLPESESSIVEVTERLAQLKAAYQAGLLTDEQYARKRTEILNDL